MTIDQRFDRLEHFTAGLAEQWQVEREENRQLWRNTQAQLDRTAELLQESIREAREQDRVINERIAALDEEYRKHMAELGQETDKRIHDLVRAIAKMIPPAKGNGNAT